MRGKLIVAGAAAVMTVAGASAAGDALRGPGGESVRVLAPVERTVTASATGSRCTAGARPANAVDVPWRARDGVAASVLARLRGGARAGDWDLLVLDSRRRRAGAARGFGAREAVGAVARPGERLTVRACRMRGGAARVALRIDAARVTGARRSSLPASLVLVRVPRRADVELLRAVGLDLGEDGGGGDVSVVLHGSADRDALQATGLPFETVVADLAAQDRRDRAAERRISGRRAAALPSGRTTYRTYDEMQAELKKAVADHPSVARALKLELATSQGREVSGIEIADDPARAATDGRPTFFLVGVHHAREWPAAEMVMEHVLDILSTRSEPATADLLRRVRIVAVPVQNPDGYTWSRASTPTDNAATELGFGAGAGGIQAYRRKTCSGPFPAAAPCDLQPGADSNRNYGANWSGIGSSTIPYEQDYRGAAPWSEPETENIHRLLRRTNATAVMSMHNVLGAVLRPPGVTSDGKPHDEAAMKALGDEMARMTGYSSASFAQGLGYDGSGITEDWAYSEQGAFTYTIEVGPAGGSFHGPYDTHVIEQWDGPKGKGGIRAALRRFAEAAGQAQHHAVLSGRAPRGATLRLAKSFQTTTKPACTFAAGITARNASPDELQCVGAGAPIVLDDSLEYTMTVGDSGAYEWHVPPSTRPALAAQGKTESYRLTCERNGAVIETREVVAARGSAQAVDLRCGEPDPPVVAPTVKKPTVKKKKAAAKKKKAKPKKKSSKRKSKAKRKSSKRKRCRYGRDRRGRCRSKRR